jgi:hypothetical protein
LRFHPNNDPAGAALQQSELGGFIIWSLPDYPVAIDGRTDLYGDAAMSRFFV